MTSVGTVLADVVYFPAKLLFEGGGAVVSGVSYVATLGRPQPTDEIWDTSVKGSYLVTPRTIEGKVPRSTSWVLDPNIESTISARTQN